MASAEKLLTAEACHSKDTPQQFNYVNIDQNKSQDSDDNEDRNWQNKNSTQNEQPKGRFDLKLMSVVHYPPPSPTVGFKVYLDVPLFTILPP